MITNLKGDAIMKTLDLGFEDFINESHGTKYYDSIKNTLLLKDLDSDGKIELSGYLLGISNCYCKIEKPIKNREVYRVKLVGKESNRLEAVYSFYKYYNTNTYNIMPFNVDYDDDISEVTIMHHIDLDGLSSASLFYRLFEPVMDIIDVPFNYDMTDAIRNRLTRKEEESYGERLCIIVDLSITAEDLLYIMNNYDYVLYLDHHESSFKTIGDLFSNYKDEEGKLIYTIDTRFSATYLTQLVLKDYLYRYQVIPKDHLNTLYAGLVSTYDTKNSNVYPKAYEEGLKLNQYFNDIVVLGLDSEFWYTMWQLDPTSNKYESLEKVLDVGEKLLNLNKIKLELLYKHEYKYVFKYRNHTIKCINGIGNSQRFCNDPEIDVCIIGRDKGFDKFTVSVYSDDEEIKKKNIGTILRKWYNGGGHPGAGGFSMSKSVFRSIGSPSKLRMSIHPDPLMDEIHHTLLAQYPNLNIQVYPYQKDAINRVEPFYMEAFLEIAMILFYEIYK